MLAHDENASYDGGYSTSSLDDALIHDAVAEATAAHPDHPSSPIPLMCYLASQYVMSRAEYENCERFIQCYVFACMDVNFGETDNVVAAELHANDC